MKDYYSGLREAEEFWRIKLQCFKIIFGMQLLKIYYVISEEKFNFEENSETKVSWERDDHFWRSYLLNYFADHLAYVYSNKLSANNIWNALED